MAHYLPFQINRSFTQTPVRLPVDLNHNQRYIRALAPHAPMHSDLQPLYSSSRDVEKVRVPTQSFLQFTQHASLATP